MDAVPTDLDRRIAQRQCRPQPVAAGEGQIAAGKAATTGTAPQPAARSSDRWATFNTFMDVIGPRLTLAERAVWLVMFRHARGGVVNASERQLSTAANIDKVTAGRALRQLVELRLVWPVFKSTNKGSASRYGLQPHPDACLAAVIRQHEQRHREASERREAKGGDRRGRRPKEAMNRVNGSPG